MTFNIKVTIESVEEWVVTSEICTTKYNKVKYKIDIEDGKFVDFIEVNSLKGDLYKMLTDNICGTLEALSEEYDTGIGVLSKIDWFVNGFQDGATTKYTVSNDAFLEIEIDTQDIDFSSFTREFFKEVRLWNLSVHVSDEVQAKNMEDCFTTPIVVNARG